MLSELLISYLGWNDVWFSGTPGIRLDQRWHVGIWTGPQNDLLATKRCVTTTEANEYLAPGADTILGACVKSLLLLAKRDGWDSVRKLVRMSPIERLTAGFTFDQTSQEEWKKAEAHLDENLPDEAFLALMHGTTWGKMDYAQAVRLVENIKKNAEKRRKGRDGQETK